MILASDGHFVRYDEIPASVVGVLSGLVWRAKSSDSGILVVEGIGDLDAGTYFPLMDRKADKNYMFNEKSTYFEEEDSVVVKAGAEEAV
jgi:hypothetical protein